MASEQTGKLAMVVDDDSDIREIVKGYLQSEGWETVEAENGEEASLVAIREFPQLIVMDVMMPIMSGFEAFKELREDPRTAHIPIILLTAVNEFEIGTHHDLESVGRSLGVPYPDSFLEKPVDKDELLEAARRAVS